MISARVALHSDPPSVRRQEPARDRPAHRPRARCVRCHVGDLAALRDLCGGAVHLPGDPGYDDARMPWNVAVDQRPAAVAYPASAAEVAEVVRAAAALGLRVAAQGTGHNAGPLGALDDVVLVRTSAMTGVTVDRERLVARAEAGVLWEDVVTAVAEHGLTALHGSSPDVGVAGYSLGGGIGWYARKLGMQANNVTALEVVTPAGDVVRADAESNADLFWALRGGGGNFGVVTALEFRVFDFDTAYAGWLVYDGSRAAEVLRAWSAWSVDAPDEVTTAWRILNVPPIEEMPPPFRGRTIVVIDGAVMGTDEEAAAVLAPLRALEPEMDTFERQPTAALIRLHMDPEGPTPAVSDSLVLDSLPDAAIDALVAAAGPGSGSTLHPGRAAPARRGARARARGRRRAADARRAVPLPRRRHRRDAGDGGQEPGRRDPRRRGRRAVADLHATT